MKDWATGFIGAVLFTVGMMGCALWLAGFLARNLIYIYIKGGIK